MNPSSEIHTSITKWSDMMFGLIMLQCVCVFQELIELADLGADGGAVLRGLGLGT